MNQLSLKNNQLKVKTTGKLPIVLEECIEYTPILLRNTKECHHMNWLKFKTSGKLPIMLEECI